MVTKKKRITKKVTQKKAIKPKTKTKKVAIKSKTKKSIKKSTPKKKTEAKSKKNKTIKKATKKKIIKKVVKKTIKINPKKTAAKSKIKKKVTKKTTKIKDKFVVSELAFYCCDNKIFYNLNELADGLLNMSNDTYSFHVNELKNDFYNWIRYVYRELTLANAIKKAKNSKDMRKIIKDFI